MKFGRHHLQFCKDLAAAILDLVRFYKIQDGGIKAEEAAGVHHDPSKLGSH